MLFSLSVQSYNAKHGQYFLMLSNDEERDDAKQAIWSHINNPPWYNNQLGAPDSQKNRDILLALAQCHQVELIFEKPQPMNSFAKKNPSSIKAI